MSLNDFPLLALLFVLVPVLVGVYLKKRFFARSFRLTAVLGGWLWLVYAIFGEEITEFLLDIPPSDSPIHGRLAMDLVRLMDRNQWQAIWSDFGSGNYVYQIYLALTHYFLGATEPTWVATNGMVAFWGGLMLISHLGTMFPAGRRRNLALLFILFCPSVIFWSSTNLKEGLMYWSICCIFSSTFHAKGGSVAVSTPLLIAGSLVGGLLRPHVVTGWVTAVFTVNLLQRRRLAHALVLMFAIPLILVSAQRLTGAALDVDSATEMAQSQYKIMKEIKGGSSFDEGSERPIPFVSGFVSIFFRPFPWEIRSVRLLFAIIETWTITLLMIGVWLKMSRNERAEVFRFPEIQTAAIALAWGAFLLSYFPNTGLVMRQRVQMVPALLVLTLMPILYRGWIKEKTKGTQRSPRPSFTGTPIWVKGTDVPFPTKKQSPGI